MIWRIQGGIRAHSPVSEEAMLVIHLLDPGRDQGGIRAHSPILEEAVLVVRLLKQPTNKNTDTTADAAETENSTVTEARSLI